MSVGMYQITNEIRSVGKNLAAQVVSSQWLRKCNAQPGGIISRVEFGEPEISVWYLHRPKIRKTSPFDVGPGYAPQIPIL